MEDYSLEEIQDLMSENKELKLYSVQLLTNYCGCDEDYYILSDYDYDVVINMIEDDAYENFIESDLKQHILDDNFDGVDLDDLSDEEVEQYYNIEAENLSYNVEEVLELTEPEYYNLVLICKN